VALTSLLVFGSLSPLASPASAEWVSLAIWLSLYSGIIQFLLGTFRMGRIACLVSQPVIVGFTNAAALLIILSQLPAMFGLSRLSLAALVDFSHRLLAGSPATLMTIAFGFGTLALLLLAKRFLPNVPGMLLATVASITLSWVVDYKGLGGQIVGALPAGMPALSIPPAILFDRHMELLPAALIIALISFTEAMSSCRVLARKQRERWDENQELVGQGLAKIASAFSGSFPVSGSFSRSALNLYAGAVSAWSTLFSAACVLLSLLFLTDWIYYIPRAALAAMIMVPVFGLLNPGGIRRVLSHSRGDGVIAMVTFAVTLLSAPRLHWGIFTGIGLTMASYLYRRTRPRIIEAGQHPDGTLRDRNRFDLPRLAPDVLAVRMDAALNFLTASALERFIADHCSSDQGIRHVLLCASGINDIDATGIDTLESLHATLAGEGINLYVSAVKKQVWDVLDRAGLIKVLGRERLFATDAAAIRSLVPHTRVLQVIA
jgi:SulP family sulfate permease